MDKVILKTKTRDKSENLTRLRKAGEVPAVLYGHNVRNANLSVKKAEFEKAFKKAGESSIIDLITQDGQTRPVLIHDVQTHYLTGKVIHADFYQVSMTEKLKAKVALEFTGEAPAVKALGGILVKVLSDVEVQCLPADLPHNLQVDISTLTDFASAVLVKDIKIPDKVRILTSPEETVVKVQPPRNVEAELAAPATDEKAAVEAAVAASEKPKSPEVDAESGQAADEAAQKETKKKGE